MLSGAFMHDMNAKESKKQAHQHLRIAMQRFSKIMTRNIIVTCVLHVVIVVAYGIENCVYYVPRDCQDHQLLGHTESGVYRVVPAGTFDGFDVYCDMTADRGGWLVFQKRVDGSLDFYRTWQEYATGFGEKTGEHWLGNIALNIITSQYRYQLRIELEDWEGNTIYANYQMFRVGTPAEKYKLEVDGYSGNAGDALSYHNSFVFSTKDKTFNSSSGWECANLLRGAWWFHDCMLSHLNGEYYPGGNHSGGDKPVGIQWDSLRKAFNYSYKTTEMKIKRI